ncbi:MAG TPA: beta-galactosidase, partial [Anaerolineaceae bacterium]|nr:beta-galactosidase [Anaerolineaceae bacterium]
MKPSNFPDQTLQIKDGIFTCRGKSQFFASADYPYFRDDPENWSDRLDKLIQIGQRVITTYIPWRHHDVRDQGGQRYDFTGETLASRNVVGFIELCQQKGLSLVIKPRPFAHAELNYGGLPDFVCPKIDPRIQAMIGSDGTPFVWNGSALTA